MQEGEPYIPPFVRRAMKNATEDELRQAADYLRGYIQAVYATFLRMEAERAKNADCDSADVAAHDRFGLGGLEPPQV
jgi:hypothetical protein